MARRTPLRILQSVLYHSSFAFLVLLTLIAVAGSAWGLISQAWSTGGQRRWNIVILVAGYGAVLFVSFFICIGRILNIRYTLQTIPRPYVPIKEADLEPKLSRHIAAEYTRTSVIAHVQQPTAGEQEGWGSPGSAFPSLHYQTFLLQKLHAINALLPPLPASAAPLMPPLSPHKIRTLPLFYHPLLNTNLTEPLARIVDTAQYSGREMTEGEVEKGVKILWAVQTIINQSIASSTTSPSPNVHTVTSPHHSHPNPHTAPVSHPFRPPPLPPNVSPIDFAISPTSTNRQLHHPGREMTSDSAWTKQSGMSESDSVAPLLAPREFGGR